LLEFNEIYKNIHACIFENFYNFFKKINKYMDILKFFNKI
jgi:hypothetical protein